jgi:hypothetical protein
MEATPHQRDRQHPNTETTDTPAIRADMEASARALFAADGAHVREAMNSVKWERRGLLQRLTRGTR